ncbi:MAG: glycosyltransferase [Gemmatimonadales bacterium]|nr:glycosyltransferase [Gemmatimonadales bacterium]MDZ4390493.1 glycosyltransferase [Gemmatimonadales bacterium]
MSRPEILVVIPAWNEANRLDSAAISAFLARHDAVTICLVDDGSTDATPQLLKDLASGSPDRVKVLTISENRGKAEAVRQGLLWAVAEGYGMAGYLDADLAAPLESTVLLREELEAHPALVMAIGSRVKLLGWQITRSERRHYLGRVFATFASLTLGLPVYDTQCGAKMLRLVPAVVAALQEPFLSRWLFDVELIARLRDGVGAERLREVPLPVWRDPGGSNVRISDFLKAPWELWRIRMRHPLPARDQGGAG